MLTTPAHWIVSLSVQSGSDTGRQNACHHLLEQKSVTGDFLIMYKTHVSYTNSPAACTSPFMDLYVHKYNHQTWKSDDIICHYMSHRNENTNFRHQYFNSLWTASKTCAALLKASCLQFEVCHGWFSLTWRFPSADKDARDTVDMSLVFLGVLRKTERLYIPGWLNRCYITF